MATTTEQPTTTAEPTTTTTTTCANYFPSKGAGDQCWFCAVTEDCNAAQMTLEECKLEVYKRSCEDNCAGTVLDVINNELLPNLEKTYNELEKCNSLECKTEKYYQAQNIAATIKAYKQTDGILSKRAMCVAYALESGNTDQDSTELQSLYAEYYKNFQQLQTLIPPPPWMQ